jgi:predicted transposase YdaD
MRSPAMRESTMYQSILREGRTTEGRSLVLKQLARKLGSLSPELTARVSCLSLDQLEALSEALLDFDNLEDLQTWLD